MAYKKIYIKKTLFVCCLLIFRNGKGTNNKLHVNQTNKGQNI